MSDSHESMSIAIAAHQCSGERLGLEDVALVRSQISLHDDQRDGFLVGGPVPLFWSADVAVELGFSSEAPR